MATAATGRLKTRKMKTAAGMYAFAREHKVAGGHYYGNPWLGLLRNIFIISKHR